MHAPANKKFRRMCPFHWSPIVDNVIHTGIGSTSPVGVFITCILQERIRMNEFMLLFRGGDARMADLTEDERNAHMAKWGAWMQGLAEQGKLVGGLPFEAEGKVVSNNGVDDGPYREGSVSVGGYLHIKAGDLNEAVAISKGSPIFEHDGSVEVRGLASM